MLNKHILSSVRLTNTPKGIFTNFKAFFCCRVDEFSPAGQGTKLEKKNRGRFYYINNCFGKEQIETMRVPKQFFLKLQLREI